jgi:hypothetical protein
MRRLPPAGVLLPLVLAIALMPVVEHLAFASNDDPAARASATCSDYSNQRDAQLKRDTRDADGDGIYCESLPCPCLEPGRAGGGGGGSRKGDDPRGCRLVRRPVRVRFDDDRWPHIADHIRDAQRLRDQRGRLRFRRVFHIDRAGADENRRQSLQGILTRKGFDRDEYPPAVAREGGKGAHVRYVRSGENRSAGSFMGHELEGFCSKQRFQMLAVR